MRALTFDPHGEGDIVYLVLESRRRVEILVVLSPSAPVDGTAVGQVKIE